MNSIIPSLKICFLESEKIAFEEKLNDLNVKTQLIIDMLPTNKPESPSVVLRAAMERLINKVLYVELFNALKDQAEFAASKSNFVAFNLMHEKEKRVEQALKDLQVICRRLNSMSTFLPQDLLAQSRVKAALKLTDPPKLEEYFRFVLGILIGLNDRREK